MQESLVPITLPPGMYRVGTRLDASGRWYDGNLMRWVEGQPQPIGGWRRMLSETTGNVIGLLGTVQSDGPELFRSAFAWRTSEGEARIAFGSTDSVYVITNDSGSWSRQNISPPIAGFIRGFRLAGVSGSAEDATLGVIPASTWTFDNFGEVLVGLLDSDGDLFQWVGGAGVDMTAVSGAPTSNSAVVVTPERFVVLLGAGGDVRKVQWPDQETLTTWTPTADNQAGDFILQTNGSLMCGARTKSQTLLWTDVDLWSMNYIGGELVYGFQQEGDACGIISRNAKVVVDTQVFWMGRNNFYKYDGFVQPIPCPVRDYVFEDFNRVQASQTWAMSIAEFGEVWWFYCSTDSLDIDRYVVYNYRDNIWYFGSGLERTCGIDAGVHPVPLMLGYPTQSNPNGLAAVFDHEYEENRGGNGDSTRMTAYLESGPIVLDKDRVMRIQRIVPDVSALSDAEISIYTSMYPTESETLNGPYTLANPTDVRLTAKHIRVRVEGQDPAVISENGTSWRVGTTQLGVIPLGRR